MNEFTKPLADAIRKARAQLGLMQEQFAELAGTDPMNIMKMENTNRNANPDHLLEAMVFIPPFLILL